MSNDLYEVFTPDVEVSYRRASQSTNKGELFSVCVSALEKGTIEEAIGRGNVSYGGHAHAGLLSDLEAIN